MAGDYQQGRADGLREAVDILRRLEEGVARRLDRPTDRKTRDARRVRHKTLQVAGTRVTTVLKRADRRARGGGAIPSDLKELGL